jgi:ParB family chromosome partitioning protein
MPKKHGLGRGLGALIKDGTSRPEPEPAATLRVQIDRIAGNSLQPRRVFEPDAMAELAASVRERGILQPLLVRSQGDGFELIAGERRLRAAVDAGLKEVPVIVSNAGDAEALEIALVENLQREDLNAIEEAEGYRTLAERFDLTQDQIAARVGKARASVANSMRLLELPAEIKDHVAAGRLSAGHAKLLAGLDSERDQLLFCRTAVSGNLSVRNLEKVIWKAGRAPRKPRAVRNDIPPDHLADLSDRLHRHFGTNVRITPSRTFANGKKGKGAIEIDFYSNDDLDRILELLGVTGE